MYMLYIQTSGNERISPEYSPSGGGKPSKQVLHDLQSGKASFQPDPKPFFFFQKKTQNNNIKINNNKR